MTATPLSLIPHRKLAARFGVTPRTLDDWTKRGALPSPIRICGRKYWPADTQPKTEATPRTPMSGGARGVRR